MPQGVYYLEEISMCRAVRCQTCGKTTAAGCGRHIDQVMATVPKAKQCKCPPPEPKPGFLAGLFGRGKA